MIQCVVDETLLYTPVRACYVIANVATGSSTNGICGASSKLPIPKRWFFLPCILCILGHLPGFVVYFSDCGWPKPWSWKWHQCITLYWDTFLETCQQSAVCRGILKTCSYLCGIGFVEKAFDKDKPAVVPVPAQFAFR